MDEEIKETETTEKEVENKDTQENKEVYNNNKAEEKSLEQEVLEAKDKKYLAEQIVKTNEELSSLRNDMNTILKILQSNSKSFTNSEVSSQDNNSDNKYLINIDK